MLKKADPTTQSFMGMSPDTINTIKNILTGAGAGAGLGAAGMGLGSYMLADDSLSPEERKQKAMDSAYQGAALGGLAGGGFKAFERILPVIGKDSISDQGVSTVLKNNPGVADAAMLRKGVDAAPAIGAGAGLLKGVSDAKGLTAKLNSKDYMKNMDAMRNVVPSPEVAGYTPGQLASGGKPVQEMGDKIRQNNVNFLEEQNKAFGNGHTAKAMETIKRLQGVSPGETANLLAATRHNPVASKVPLNVHPTEAQLSAANVVNSARGHIGRGSPGYVDPTTTKPGIKDWITSPIDSTDRMIASKVLNSDAIVNSGNVPMWGKAAPYLKPAAKGLATGTAVNLIGGPALDMGMRASLSDGEQAVIQRALDNQAKLQAARAQAVN